jgi:hypothetical protein
MIRSQNDPNMPSLSKFYSKLIEYAKLLADQGCFLNAFNYLKDLNDVKLNSIFGNIVFN